MPEILLSPFKPPSATIIVLLKPSVFTFSSRTGGRFYLSISKGGGIDKHNYMSIIIVIMRTQYLQELPEHWLNTAKVLHALGDATRQRILLLFEPEEELSIKAIADLFPYSRTNMTHHITVLEGAGILTRSKSGRDVFLRLNKEVLIKALESVLTYVKTEI